MILGIHCKITSDYFLASCEPSFILNAIFFAGYGTYNKPRVYSIAKTFNGQKPLETFDVVTMLFQLIIVDLGNIENLQGSIAIVLSNLMVCQRYQ